MLPPCNDRPATTDLNRRFPKKKPERLPVGVPPCVVLPSSRHSPAPRLRIFPPAASRTNCRARHGRKGPPGESLGLWRWPVLCFGGSDDPQPKTFFLRGGRCSDVFEGNCWGEEKTHAFVSALMVCCILVYVRFGCFKGFEASGQYVTDDWRFVAFDRFGTCSCKYKVTVNSSPEIHECRPTCPYC